MGAMPLIAVDIGNARMKLASFHREQNEGMPEPESLLTLEGSRPSWEPARTNPEGAGLLRAADRARS